MSYSDLFEQREDNTRDRVIKHISDKLESFSVSWDLCLVELVFPFLDMYNDLIVIDIEKAGDAYIVSDGIQFGAAIDGYEQHIQAFLSAFNNAECTSKNAIQYDSAYGFRARASYENLPNVILKMLSFLIKFIGFIEFQRVMEEADTLMEEYEQQKIDQLRARVKELEAINKAMLSELNRHRKLCPWQPIMPDCSDARCMNQENCSILKVISKAKGRTNGCRS